MLVKMIKYLNIFSNVNTRNDNNSISDKILKTQYHAQSQKVTLHAVHCLSVCWSQCHTTWRRCVESSDHRPQGSSALDTRQLPTLMLQHRCPHPHEVAVFASFSRQVADKKGWARKAVYESQPEVDPRVSCGGDIKFDTKDKKCTNINPKKPSPSACS